VRRKAISSQTGGARDGPRQAAHVERAQEGVGVVVGPDEHGEVLQRLPRGVAVGDHGRDVIRLAREGVEGEVLWPLAHALAAVRAARDQALVDSLGDLQPVGVIVLDQAVRGVEHRLGRAAIFLQHDLARVRIGAVEGEDVAHRRAPEPEDRLVVVAHDRDVPILRGEELHDLELGVVGVLEFVDDDEPEAVLISPQHVGTGA
jgi:hypothetical protein